MIDGERRRFVLTDFPFSLVYRIVQTEALVRVVAIAHPLRQPGYWAKR